jgi:membrane protease subunit HflC
MNKLTTIVGAAVLLLVFVFYMCSFQVRSTEIAVLKTFGKFDENDIKTEPQLYGKLPWPIESVVITDNRTRVLKDTYEETPTRDSQNLMVTTYTCWRIDKDNPYKFHIANSSSEEKAEEKLRNLVQAQKKIVIAQHDLSDLVNTDPTKFKYDQIEQELMERTVAIARDEYGIDIQAMGIRRLSFPKSVSEKIFDRMKAHEQSKAAKYETEGEAEAQAIVAEASAVSRNIVAVADRLAEQIKSEAKAEVGEYYKEFDEHAELRLFLDRLEATVRALQERTTIILDSGTAPFNLFNFDLEERADANDGDELPIALAP